MKEKLITIIIPIYNSKKYLKKTIETVLQQTYNNYELILIDDGSTDNSLEICKNYEKIDKRIKVFTQKNKGVATARNKGIENSQGEFICFMDSDDYIEKTMLDQYIKVSEIYKPDLIVSGYFSEVDLDEKITYDKIYCPNKNYKNIEEIKQDFVLLWDKHLLYNIWNKLYSARIIKEHQIKFPDSNWGEDIEFNRQYLLKINTLYNMQECFYHYIRGRKETITGKYIENLYDIRLKEDEEFREYFKEYGINEEDYREFCARRHIERTLGCIENLFNKNCKLNLRKKRNEVKRILEDQKTRKYLKEMKPNSKKMKILLIPYKMKSVAMAMIIGKILSICKEKFPDLFNGLKNKR